MLFGFIRTVSGCICAVYSADILTKRFRLIA